jgi:hypothetical protein
MMIPRTRTNDSKRILTIGEKQPRQGHCRVLGNGTHWRLTGCAGVHVKVDEINIENCRRKLRKIAWLERRSSRGAGVAEMNRLLYIESINGKWDLPCSEEDPVDDAVDCTNTPPTPPNTNANGTAYYDRYCWIHDGSTLSWRLPYRSLHISAFPGTGNTENNG